VADSQVNIIVSAKNDADTALKKAQQDVAELSDALKDQLKAQQALNNALANAKGPQQFYEAEKSLTQVAKDIAVTQNEQASATKAVTSAQRDADSAAQKLASSHQGLFTTFTAATLAANGIISSLGTIRQTLTDSVQAATNYQNAMTGLSSYAQAFGVSADSAKQAVQQLSNDGLVPVTTSANALKNLLSTGIGLDKSIQLMDVFKDRAAFGRAATVDYGTAVQNLSEFFKTGRSQLGDLNGVTTNYNQLIAIGAQQMGVNASQLNEAGKYQAAYLGLLQDSVPALGDAAAYAQTFAGRQAQLTYEINQTEVALGSALQPAITQVTQSITSFLGELLHAGGNSQVLQANLLTLATVGTEAINILIGTVEVLGAALVSIFTFNPQVLVNAINDAGKRITSTAADYQTGITAIANGEEDKRAGTRDKALAAANDAYVKANEKLDQQTAKENQSFADSMTQRTRGFQQSMTDMIIAHRDKAASIQADLAKEDAAYAASTAQKQQALNDDLSSLEDQHKTKVSDIAKQISDEKSRSIIIDGVRQSNADRQKLDDLQAQLDKETAKYDQQVAKRQAQYATDTANALSSHNQKLADLQKNLDAETAILQKHAAEAAAVGNKQKDDDITRLQQQYAQENAQATIQHVRRLAELQQQGGAQGTTLAQATADATKAYNEQHKDEMAKSAHAQGVDISNAMWDGFKQQMGSFFADLPMQILNLAKAHPFIAGTLAGGPIMGAVMGLFSAGMKAMHVPGWASGTLSAPGGLSLVGEQGPELINMPTGAQVYNATDTRQMLANSSGGGFTLNGVTINNYTPYSVQDQLRNFYWMSRR